MSCNSFNGRKVVFLHLPKTAGTTFKNILFSFFDEGEICPIWDEALLRKNIGKNIEKYRLFHGHFSYDLISSFPEKPIVLTFLRDPVSRIWSQYNYEKTLSDRDVYNLSKEAASVVNMAKSMSFGDYISQDNRFLERMTSNIQTRKLASSSDHPLSYIDDANLIRLALGNMKDFDFVGIQENFDDSVKLFFDIFSLGDGAGYESKNVTKNKRKQDFDVFDIGESLVRKVKLDEIVYARAFYDLKYNLMVRGL